jgi:hypothetical protein
MELYFGEFCDKNTLYEYNVMTFCVFPIPTYQKMGEKYYGIIKILIFVPFQQLNKS